MNPRPISNSKLTLLRKLSQKKYRQRERLFMVEGARAVEQIIANDRLIIEALYFDENQKYWLQEPWKQIAQGIRASLIDTTIFAEVSDTDNPQGVIALSQIPEEIDLKELAQQKGIIVATDAIQDPGNLGTIVRTACWFGVQGILCGKGTVDLFHPKVVRSTAGATGAISYRNAELSEALPVFENNGWQIMLLDAGQDAMNINETEKGEKMILVIGNEANGIDPNLCKSGRKKVKILSAQGHQVVESLNAAIATSIALYAWT